MNRETLLQNYTGTAGKRWKKGKYAGLYHSKDTWQLIGEEYLKNSVAIM
jgi:hypothetical protein